MTGHWLACKYRCSGVCRKVAVGFLASGLLLLAGASGAAAYTFTKVASPSAREVVFSPRGAFLAEADQTDVLMQTVSKHAKFGTVFDSATVDPCKPGHSFQFPGLDTISAIAYSPSGAFLAEVETPGAGQPTGTLRVYRTHGTKLSSKSCRALPYHATSAPGPYYSVAFGPGRLLAVTNEGKNTVSVYSFTKAGKLTQLRGSPFSTGKEPAAVAFGPTRSGGEAMAIANRGSNDVSTFTVSSGSVAPAAGSPFVALAGPSSLAFSPVGGLLAVGEAGAGGLTMYQVSFVGKLTGVAGAFTGGATDSVAFGRYGDLLGAATPGGVSVFTVTESGQVAQVSGSPISAPDEESPVSIAFSPTASLLAVGGGGAVYSYKK